MRTLQNKPVVFLDTDCICSSEVGCACIPSSKTSKKITEPQMVLIEVQKKCDCNDFCIAKRINKDVQQFLHKRFLSHRWLKHIFKDKIDCAQKGVNIKVRTIISCNPLENASQKFPKEMQAHARKRHARRNGSSAKRRIP